MVSTMFMTMAARKELFGISLSRYLKASKQEKTVMLNELEKQTGMHRKALIRSFKNLQMKDPADPGKKRGRREKYGPRVTAALKEAWEISSELCAERLHPVLSEYVRKIQADEDWKHSEEATRLLLEMSLGTMKNRIRNFSSLKKKQRNTTTSEGSIKTLIPIRRGPWKNPKPGLGEIDTVVHCGSTLAGDVAYSVVYADIATAWVELACQLNKGKHRTLESIKTIDRQLPFALKGLDPDTGSEFINWHLKGWCDEEKVKLTRSRPYHKNDNAHVEQKNYDCVRRFLGYWRMDTEEQIALVNQLYQGPLRLYLNFFQPSVKLIKKERVGSRYVRKHAKAKTPYQRVLGDKRISEEIKKELTRIYETLNPLKLKREIDTLIEKIKKLRRSS